MFGLSQCSSNRPRDGIEDIHARTARRAAKDVAREHGNFDNRVHGGEIHDNKDGRDANQVGGRDEAGNLPVDDSERELADDVKDRCGDDLIEGILNERFEPTPEKPIKLGNDEERDKHRSQENETAVATTPNATTMSARAS